MSILWLQVNYRTHKTKYYGKSCILLYLCEFYINVAYLTVHSIRFFPIVLCFKIYTYQFQLCGGEGACSSVQTSAQTRVMEPPPPPQVLHTQAFLNFSTWVLGIQLWSSARVGNAPNCWAISSVFIFNLKVFPQKYISQSSLGLIWTIELQRWLTENTISNIKCFCYASNLLSEQLSRGRWGPCPPSRCEVSCAVVH